MLEALLVRLVLVLLAVVCLGSFSWARRWFFVRRQEASPWRRGLGPFGSFFGLATLMLLFLSDRAESHYSATVAGALFLSAAALFWSSIRAFGARRPSIAFTPGAPTVLVTSGPYLYVRHPLYVAYMLYWVGALFAVPGVISVAGVAIMGFLYWRAAREEEAQILDSAVRNEYLAYMAKTGMFIPRLHR